MNNQILMSAEMTGVILDFIKEFMPWQDLRPEYIRVYTEVYTEAELRELIAFFKSPIGRKMLDVSPIVMEKIVEFRQKQMQKHLPELQRRIRERLGG